MKLKSQNIIKDIRKMGHIVFALGILLVLVFTYWNPPLQLDPKHALALITIGLIVGLIDVKKEQSVPFLLAFIGLIITANAPLHAIEFYNIGVYAMSFFKNTAIFLSLAVGIVSVKIIYRIYKGSA
jgi:hypothetical protein